jgi:acyl transferase domain-containing protein
MFDNACFGVSSAEAGIMDPQQRMVLEHSLSAAHGAGVTKAQLMGSSTTAVYVGIWQCEYADVVSNSSAALSVFAATAAACKGRALPSTLLAHQRWSQATAQCARYS